MVNNFIQYILWDGKVLFNLNGIFYVRCCLTDIKRMNVVSVISLPFNILCGKQSVDWSDKKVKGITRFEGSPITDIFILHSYSFLEIIWNSLNFILCTYPFSIS